MRVLAVLLPVITALVLATVPASASPPSLWRLTDLVAQRVRIADQVAAAKYGTGSPIDDPVREQQIYDSVAARAPELGLDPAEAVRFFRAQVEASKLVQRGLHARWAEHPAEAPATRPDLTEIRPAIDRMNTGLLAELAATRQLRTARTCPARLLVAARVADVVHRFDALHARALRAATAATCAV
ncbi:chorismate mutase [Amycolatopsis sp. OK19-0408]|uniref:Chorismate mutase n=1 Tax=Amycolatopsis iheyensis TaxID=2945988 RepID=A0A9X2ND40_9PSEU|nr:chorismate mutase [Amycolatopsis iheyensis]MCR6486586.1 chorismate mutase [Amycolatopsis iheyensis]